MSKESDMFQAVPNDEPKDKTCEDIFDSVPKDEPKFGDCTICPYFPAICLSIVKCPESQE